MAITSLMVKGLAISPEAIQRNVDEWERRGRSWQGVDRFEMTEQQMISVVEKLYDTDYFSSTYLMSPSIPEFAVHTLPVSATAFPFINIALYGFRADS